MSSSAPASGRSSATAKSSARQSNTARSTNTSRSNAENIPESARSSCSSFRSPVPIVPQLSLNKKLNTSSQALSMGGSMDSKWSSKTVSQPNAFPVFKKTTASKRNDSSLFSAHQSPKQANNGSRGQSLHTDPFSEVRPRHQPKIKKTITHPSKPEDNRFHMKLVKPVERKVYSNEMITQNGVTFSRGKATTDKKYESAKLMGTNMDCTPLRKQNFNLNLRFASSPKGKADRGASEHSIINPPSAKKERPHTRIVPKTESLGGVFVGEALKARKHTNQPPWHTATPRSKCNKPKMHVPWHTSTPRTPQRLQVAHTKRPSPSPVPVTNPILQQPSE